MPGIFITFEGPDGSGKTTQLQRLADKLRSIGKNIVVTREPGGTTISDQIRKILLAPEHSEMVDQAEILLYAASRAQHVHELILPALEQGKIVICDRFIDASIAYQSYGLGIDSALVQNINEFASSHLQPKRTYLLDVPVSISQQRIKYRAAHSGQQNLDRIESKQENYHERVRNAFLSIARNHPERVMLLNGERHPDELAQDIWTDIKRMLQL